MMSANSSSEKHSVSFLHLMRENLRRRIWSVALCSLLFFFMFPITMLLQVSHYLDASNFVSLTDPAPAMEHAKQQVFLNFIGWVETDDPFLSFILLCLAVVIAASAFSWLHNSRKTDFYHSLPVSRARLFHAVNLNSLLIVGVPYLIMSLLAAAITQTSSGHSGCFLAAFLGYLGHMAFFLLGYMTVVLAMMLTGNVFVGLLGTGTFLLWGPCLVGLVFGLMNRYFYTFCDSEEMIQWFMQRSSAFLWMFPFSEDAAVSAPVRAVSALAASAVLMIIDLRLYFRRRSESAGHAMAFGITEAPIKLMIIVPIAIGCGLIFHELMESDAWALFAIVCALLIGGCIIEIIFRFDFRQLFAHKSHLLIGLLLSLGIFAFFRFDLAGYDRYLPDRSKLSSAGVVSDIYDNIWNYNHRFELHDDGDTVYLSQVDNEPTPKVLRRMELHDLDTVYALAGEGIAEAAMQRDIPFGKNRFITEESRDTDVRTCKVYISWHFANGRQVLRQYTVNAAKLHNDLDRLHDSADYKNAFYPVFSVTADDLAGINYQDIDNTAHIRFSSDADMKELLQTYQEEFGALTAEDRREEMPIGALQFKTHEFQHMVDRLRETKGYIGMLSDYHFYPVYPSFSGTLAMLEKCGITLNSALDPDRIESLVINDNRSFDGDPSWEEVESKRKTPLVIRDKEQIREVLAHSFINGLNCENRLGPVYYGLDVSVRAALEESEAGNDPDALDSADAGNDADAADPDIANGHGDLYTAAYENSGSIDFYSYSLSLDAANIPGLIRDYFELTDDDIRRDTVQSY